MEALAALSLACNVLQLVDTGFKALKAVKAIRDEHQPDSMVQSNALVLQQLGREVAQSVLTQGDSSVKTGLCRSAQDVVSVAKELEKLLVRYTRGKTNKYRDAFSYMWKQGDIKALEQKLQKTQDALQSRILLDIWNNCQSQSNIIDAELPSLKKELGVLVSELRRGNTNISDIIAKQHAAIQQQLTSIGNDTRHIRDNFSKHIVESRHDSEIKDLLASLYFSSMNARRNMSSIVAAEGTFEWVLGSPSQSRDEAIRDSTSANKLQAWLRDPDQRIFWISGKPGSGKSTLMHYLASDAERIHAIAGGPRDACAVTLSAFIWASGDDMQKSVKGLLCTLLYQIFSQSRELARAVVDAQTGNEGNVKKISINDWSEAELHCTLSGVIKSLPKPTFTVIDGLDEIHPGDGSPDRLMDLVSSLAAHEQIKLCVSSRPELFFERSLQHYPHIRLQDLTRGDMEYYSEQQLVEALERMPESVEREHTPGAVLHYLVERSEGIFLWLVLVIQSLKEGLANSDSWEVLWERIYDLPVDLKSLYTRMVEKIQRVGSYRRFAATVFALLLQESHISRLCETTYAYFNMDSVICIALYLDGALRHDAIEVDIRMDRDIRHGLLRDGAERMRTRLRAQCAGLVEVPEPSDEDEWWKRELRFIHRTVHDFMLEDGRGLWEDAMPLDWAVCVQVQCVFLRCVYASDVNPTELWVPPARFDELDTRLLLWCSEIPEVLAGEREAAFAQLAQTMAAKGIWHKDTCNPCVRAVTMDERATVSKHWLTSWTPTGMATADFVDHLLAARFALTARYANQYSPGLVRWLCDCGARPFRRYPEHPFGTGWPSPFAMAAAQRSGYRLERTAGLLEMLQHGSIDFDEEVTIIYAFDRGIACCFNRSHCSFPVSTLPDKKDLQPPLPLLRMPISALVRLAMYDIEMDTTEMNTEMNTELLLRTCDETGTSTAPGIQLHGFVYAHIPYTVGRISGGHRLERELAFPHNTSSPEATLQAWKHLYAQLKDLQPRPGEDSSQPPMDQLETMDWLRESGLAEDNRD